MSLGYLEKMMKQFDEERSKTQMTVGKLIKKLKTFDPDMMIDGFSNPHSYRGYYVDLSFEKSDTPIQVKDAIQMLEKCVKKVFYGYKGGEYRCKMKTPCWIAYYGETGLRIMDINEKGNLILAEEPPFNPNF